MIPKEAIEAAFRARNPSWSHWLEDSRTMEREKMSAALTAAFAAMSEPVAWGHPDDFASGFIDDTATVTLADREWGEWNFPLYAAPQPASVNKTPTVWTVEFTSPEDDEDTSSFAFADKDEFTKFVSSMRGRVTSIFERDCITAEDALSRVTLEGGGE